MRVSVESSPRAEGTGPTKAFDERFLHHGAHGHGEQGTGR